MWFIEERYMANMWLNHQTNSWCMIDIWSKSGYTCLIRIMWFIMVLYTWKIPHYVDKPWQTMHKWWVGSFQPCLFYQRYMVHYGSYVVIAVDVWLWLSATKGPQLLEPQADCDWGSLWFINVWYEVNSCVNAHDSGWYIVNMWLLVKANHG